MTNAIKVAEYLRGKTVYGEMQLQKLLYYSQAWSLAWTGKALFTDEIKAWKDGPVVRPVWAAGRHPEYIVPDDGQALFLDINGVELIDVPQEEVEALVVAVADSGLEAEDVALWLTDRV